VKLQFDYCNLYVKNGHKERQSEPEFPLRLRLRLRLHSLPADSNSHESPQSLMRRYIFTRTKERNLSDGIIKIRHRSNNKLKVTDVIM